MARQLVVVTGPPADEMFDHNYMDRIGVVSHLCTIDNETLPNFGHEAYCIVRFWDGNEEMFWPEELKGVTVP